MNPAIALGPTDHGPSDLKSQNKWFFSFLISWITRIIDLSDKPNRSLMTSYKPSHVLPLTSVLIKYAVFQISGQVC